MAKKAAGRNALAPAEQVGPEFIGKSDDTLSAPAFEHQQALVEQFGDGLPWHPDHYEAAIRSELRRGCESFLRAGRYLIVARDCSLHGEWQGILDRLGMEPRQAQRMMEAARRMAALPNASTSTHLLEAAKSDSKVIELLSLPEEQFAELATTGQTGDLTVDDVAQLSVRELRAAVRELRANSEAKDQRITKLSDDLNKEHEKLAKSQRKWKAASPDERQTILEHAVTDAEAAVKAMLGTSKDGLRAAVLGLATHCQENDLDCAEFLGDVFGRLLNTVRTIRDDDDIAAAVEVPVVSDAAA